MSNPIEDYCTARSLTKAELARRVNISVGAMQHAASGKIPLSVQIYARLARELGTTIEALVGTETHTVSKGLGRPRAPKR